MSIGNSACDGGTTHIICLQIWMILLESVVQNGDHDSLAGEAHLPSCLNIEIESVFGPLVLCLFGSFGLLVPIRFQFMAWDEWLVRLVWLVGW